MRRSLGTRALPVLLLAVVGLLVVTATAVAAARPPTVKAAQISGFGKLLTTSSGLTLYHYTDEGRGKIDCKGACVKLWPPLLVKSSARPAAGPGVTASKLGTIRRPDGGLQVTYNGLALYRYAPDRKPGDVLGQGVEHAWYAISPAGKIVRRTAAPPPSYPSPGGGYGDPYG